MPNVVVDKVIPNIRPVTDISHTTTKTIDNKAFISEKPFVKIAY